MIKTKIKICILEKKRGNFALHEKFAQNMEIIDTTSLEVQHHFNALSEAGYDVIKLKWNDEIIANLKKIKWILFLMSLVLLKQQFWTS